MFNTILNIKMCHMPPLFSPGIVLQHGSTQVMQAMLWATANGTTTMADPLAPPTKTMTVMQQGTVGTTTVQAGGLMPAWQQTWMDVIIVAVTVGWLMVFTGGHGTSWQMDGQGSATPSRGWRWRQDPGTLQEHPKD